jgi:hypothetical protein
MPAAKRPIPCSSRFATSSSGSNQWLSPQSQSLMPDLLVRDLTPQPVADLLEFLASLR